MNVKGATIASDFDRRGFLLRNPLFRSMPPDAIDALAAMAMLRRLPDRARLHDKGAAPDGLYAVVDGCIRATGSTPDGREALLALMEPGTWFGESSMLEDAPRAYCADAQGDCTLLVIPRAQLLALLDARPELYRCFVPMLCQRIRLSTQLLESNAMLSMHGRLARRLLLLYQNALQGSAEQPRHSLPVSQENLGQMIGASRQSVNRMLGEWEDQGIVRRHYGGVTVLDADGLERLASG